MSSDKRAEAAAEEFCMRENMPISRDPDMRGDYFDSFIAGVRWRDEHPSQNELQLLEIAGQEHITRTLAQAENRSLRERIAELKAELAVAKLAIETKYGKADHHNHVWQQRDALKTELTAALKREEMLLAALKKYADENNWDREGQMSFSTYDENKILIDFWVDYGFTAREALSEHAKMKEKKRMDDDDRASAECNQMHIEDLNEKIESLTQALDCAVAALGYYAEPLNWQYTTYDNCAAAKPDDMGPVSKYEGVYGGHTARKKLAEIEKLRGK